MDFGDENINASFFEESGSYIDNNIMQVNQIVSDASFESSDEELNQNDLARNDKRQEGKQKESPSVLKGKPPRKKFDIVDFVKKAAQEKDIDLLNTVRNKVDKELKVMERKRRKVVTTNTLYDESRRMNEQSVQLGNIVLEAQRKARIDSLRDYIDMRKDHSHRVDNKSKAEIIKRVQAIDKVLTKIDHQESIEYKFD